MRIQEIMEAKSKKQHIDDLDDKEEVVPDAEQDDVKNIFMQIKHGLSLLQARDHDAEEFSIPIKFADKSHIHLDNKIIRAFLKKFMDAKPGDREKMQDMAIKSPQGFKAALSFQLEPKPNYKIKGDRYMSHFAGDLDEK
jgi:hypothetical protein